MTLSEISIRRPVFAWMLMAFLIVFGWISFRGMGISQLPDVDFPIVSVQVGYEGAAPEVMESEVVDAIEDSVMTVQGVRSVSSYSRQGSSSITIEFNLGRDIDAALQEVQTKVAQAQRTLPKDIDPPVITKTNPEDQPIVWLTATQKGGEIRDLMQYVRDNLKDKFSTVPGVGEVFLGGFVEPNLRVWVSNEQLNRYELTIGDIVDTLKNEHSELPAGQIETERREYDVRTMGEAQSVDEFASIIVNSRGGRPNYNPIALKQVAKVEQGLAEVRRISRFNGVPAVGLGIRKQRGSNAVQVARLVKKKMAELQKDLPPGMELALNFDTTSFIEDSIGELNFTLLLSAILTAIVCWMFLGSWSSTVNVMMAIPTSIIGAFIILYFAGFTLNTFTLLGLSLAVGIVVDDAIMVLENIVRYREKGLPRREAALVGSKEITFAAMAATVSIIAIFLPVAFMKGVIGKFFFQFGVTMTVTVALSLLEALTLTPMRCAQFIEVSERTTKFGRSIENSFTSLAAFYKRSLTWALARRRYVIIGSFIFFAISIVSVKYVNKEFSPPIDQGRFIMRIQTPIDSSLAYTNEKFKEVEAYLRTIPEVDRMYVAVGGFGGGEVNTGMIFLTMKEKGHRGINPVLKHEASQQEFMDLLRKDLRKIKDIKPVMQDLSMRGFSSGRGFPVEISVRGPDWEILGDSAKKVIAAMEKSEALTDVDTDYKLGKPEVRIYPDRVRAAQRGISIRAISETVNAMIGGTVGGKFPAGGHRYDIRVRLIPTERDQASQIKNLYVRNNRGELVRLSEVVRIEERPALQQIVRYDRERAINIYSNVKTGKSQAEALAEVQRIGKEVLPKGYRIVPSGSAQTMKESFDDLLFALVLGLIVAYMVLGSQFNSFIDPITVLIALPFSLSGAFVGLLITHQSLNVYSFIGLVLLMGIVKKNSILLVEFTNHVRDTKGLGTKEALIEACPIRLRPILMTSIATIAGAIPPALAIGPGAETRVPMAVTVIGGVIVSTVLTLYVVPCVYSVFAQLLKRKPQEMHASQDSGHSGGASAHV